MTSRTFAAALGLPFIIYITASGAAPAAAPDGRGKPARVSSASAGDPGPLEIPRIEGPIVLDGRSEEPAWSRVEPIPLVQHAPNFGQPPTERSEILLAYDDRNLYVAGRLFDSDPVRIQSNSKQRDSTDPSSEWWGVVLDTFNDKRTAVAFFTTPAGVRWDAAVMNDGQTPTSLNQDWNTVWDVAAARDGRGWFAEMRIPLSSLRFQEVGGRVTMGLISWRLVARKGETEIFPAIPPQWGFNSRFKPSRGREIVLAGVSRRAPLYVTPYVLGGLQRSPALNPAGTAYVPSRAVARNAGLDVKYGLTSRLTLDLTANTDFAQVESDDMMVNLTRFSLFFPEKRQFFQERGTIFDFPFETAEQNGLFYSRRIGLRDGALAPIYGGARLVGRVGDWDVGALSMQTAAGTSGAGENSSVLRFKRQTFNPYSYVGGIVTSRIAPGGSFNLAYGLDAQVRVFREDYLTVRAAQSAGDGRAYRPFSAAPSRVFASWLHQVLKGAIYGLVVSRAGEDFDPELGFETRRDFSRVAWTSGYAWQPGTRSPLFLNMLRCDGTMSWRNADGSLESGMAGLLWAVQTKSGWTAYLNPTVYSEDVAEPFDLSASARIGRGTFRYGDATLMVETPDSRLARTQITLQAGGFYDGSRVSLTLRPSWNLSSSLTLAAYLEVDRIGLPRPGQSFTATIARMKALYMMSTKVSASALVQYNAGAGALGANLRLRYNPREGVDLYLVYNEGLNTERGPAAPRLPLSSGRTVMVKYSYTFNL